MLQTPGFIVATMGLTHLTALLSLCLANVTGEKAAAVHLTVIEMLCQVSLYMMVVPLVELIINSNIAIKAFKHTHTPEHAMVNHLIESKKSTADDNKASHDAHMDVCTRMKMLLNLEIERCEAAKQVREAAESKTVSSATSLSNEAPSSNEITKCCDENDSSRSAASTM